jgi:putative redox protein
VAEVLQQELTGSGVRLDAFLTVPDHRRIEQTPGVVICHGFPSLLRPGRPSESYRLLAERLSDELGFVVLAVSLRGCGTSKGEFSLRGWIADLRAAVAHLRRMGVRGVWIVGSTTGGSLAILVGADDPEVKGVVAIAARADFDDWAREPRRFLQHCRDVGVVSDAYPPSVGPWAEQLRDHRPIDHVSRFDGRPLLVLHGEDDRQVPAQDARLLAEAHGSAEIRVLSRGDHRLRHDPRAVALLMGWLVQQAGADATGPEPAPPDDAAVGIAQAP